jgi:hypothetical protein
VLINAVISKKKKFVFLHALHALSFINSVNSRRVERASTKKKGRERASTKNERASKGHRKGIMHALS